MLQYSLRRDISQLDIIHLAACALLRLDFISCYSTFIYPINFLIQLSHTAESALIQLSNHSNIMLHCSIFLHHSSFLSLPFTFFFVLISI